MIQATILIADDNPGVRRVLTQCLRAGDRRHRPDLIILDMRMPGRDGRRVRAELRETDSTRHIPVLILTGLPGLVEPADLGADGYLAKPFNVNEMEERVRGLLGRKAS